ncbi:mechanosensitive ion channel family protein [Zoogloea sp.]|uniref:mechanosensitive ion channel family protein n=1 Tax=Zoogloea sp. TaxID=49181 RepID=UPI0035AF17B7
MALDSGFDPATLLTAYLIPLGWKLAGAVALWIIGGWLINAISTLSSRGMTRQKVEPTLVRYVEATLRVIMRIVLVIVILSVFGIETTSFAALIAAAGVAIGVAWSGLLSNFAAGAFLIILRPFKVGDFISGAGITGTVKEIGLFATTIDQPDDVRTTVGNNKLFSDNIVNYTANPSRRVELFAQLAHSVAPQQAMELIRNRVAQIPNVLATPAPDVEILEFNAAGTRLVVRPHCHNDHYWQVYFDTNKMLAEISSANGWPVPAPHQVLRQQV